MGDEDQREGAALQKRRRLVAVGVALALVLAVVAFIVVRSAILPPATTPEGAYVRIARSLSEGDARAVYSYLDEDARAACVAVWHDRKEASDLVENNYPVEDSGTRTGVEPESERSRLLEEYRTHASATDGADVWLDLAERRGYVRRLRQDLSGVAKVEADGDRATLTTARGTRYEFRRKTDGTWGLALFTGELVRDRERAERDLEMIRRAAADYEHARARPVTHAP